MVRLGKVYSNLMVDVRASNQKLRDRAVRIVSAAAEVERERAEEALRSADGRVKEAIVMLRLNVDFETAWKRLEDTGGRIRAAIAPIQN
jgi:N-acetylmuramic acid 6-phosphate etherase